MTTKSRYLRSVAAAIVLVAAAAGCTAVKVTKHSEMAMISAPIANVAIVCANPKACANVKEESSLGGGYNRSDNYCLEELVNKINREASRGMLTRFTTYTDRTADQAAKEGQAILVLNTFECSTMGNIGNSSGLASVQRKGLLGLKLKFDGDLIDSKTKAKITPIGFDVDAANPGEVNGELTSVTWFEEAAKQIVTEFQLKGMKAPN